ncbi:unnamed protein product [Thelazia callipaeda]|uniref:ABC transporter domain-containing protein n=1 Tax=Thelazia callipaeda TaxID=103827 RepID=A0A0N5CYX7_THECL|nr:unnamed protein product [Thelazia callipaeda]
MYHLRQSFVQISKTNPLIVLSRSLIGNKKSDEQAAVVPTEESNGISTEEVELPTIAVDAASKERAILPYSQEALKVLKLDAYPYYVEREWWKHGNRMTFWSNWKMKKDVKRRHLLAELGPDRVRLKALKSNTILPAIIRDECAKKLHEFPKASCPNNIYHLCQFSGVRRGKLNRFHLHRQIFRHLADHGQLSVLKCADVHFLTSNLVGIPSSDVTLSAVDIVEINKYVLGLTAKAPLTWSGEENIFKRPRALAVVTVAGGRALGSFLPLGFAVSGELGSINFNDLLNEKIFGGENQEWIVMSDGLISGSQIGSDAQNTFSKIEVKVKTEPLLQEIENLYKIAETIKKSEIISTAHTPTIFIIHVNGLPIVKQKLSVEEYMQAVDELEKAINYLVLALKEVYGDRVIMELITESQSEIKDIQKRQVSESNTERIMRLRRELNVYQFSSSNYPAMFGIFLSVSVILALAVLFVVVGLLNMDPGKDSIIYRMTTTRMKKD